MCRAGAETPLGPLRAAPQALLAPNFSVEFLKRQGCHLMTSWLELNINSSADAAAQPPASTGEPPGWAGSGGGGDGRPTPSLRLPHNCLVKHCLGSLAVEFLVIGSAQHVAPPRLWDLLSRETYGRRRINYLAAVHKRVRAGIHYLQHGVRSRTPLL